jgi:hypothetical protein
VVSHHETFQVLRRSATLNSTFILERPQVAFPFSDAAARRHMSALLGRNLPK